MRKPIAVAVFAFSLGPGPASGLGGGAAALTDETARPVRSLIEERHRNVVLQQWELSCAAAALATILRYQYGVPVTERSVALGLINREEYIANPELVRLRQGFSLLDLKRFVDGIGFDGIGLGQMEFITPEEIARVVVYEIKGGNTGHDVIDALDNSVSETSAASTSGVRGTGSIPTVW